MTKLEKIEKAFLELTEAEQAKFRQWYTEYDARLFDEEIERDAKAGKLDKLAEKALAEHRAGRTREL
jgi:hypothetical protein